MKPDVHFDKPGPSPFMDMDLVPKYAPVGAAAAKPKAKVKLAEPDADGKPVLYWYVHFEKSGPSPFMDMDLVQNTPPKPIYRAARMKILSLMALS